MRRILFVAALCAVLGPGLARAGEPAFTVEKTTSGGKLIRAREAIVVPGELAQPHVYYVLKRASVEYEDEALERTFLPRILEATLRHPF
jgi:hypothetical protein